jgi:hypothetical protein
MHLFRGLRGYCTSGPVAAPPSISASGTTPPTGTASGIVVPSTCAPISTTHTTSVSGGYDDYMGQAASPKSTYLPLRWLLVA